MLTDSEKASVKSRLTLRTYRHPVRVTERHSYIAGTTDLGGLSERLDTLLPYDPLVTTFCSLRPIIEHCYIDGMNRRTMFYQDLLAFMLDLENTYNYPIVQASSYRFGFFKNNCPMPKVIPLDKEDDLVANWIRDPIQEDLIIIPQTQIDPNDYLPTPTPPPTKKLSLCFSA